MILVKTVNEWIYAKASKYCSREMYFLINVSEASF